MKQELAKPILAERIEERLQLLAISARDASLKTGRGPDVIRNILRGSGTGKPYSPRSDTLQLVASVLKTTPEWLLGQDLMPPAPEPKIAEGYRPEPQLYGARDLKIYSAVEGGPGEMVVSNEPIDIVWRPWYLRNVKDGYGVVVTGESMWPKYEPGDIVLVNPRLPLIRGRAAIFTAEQSGGDFKATIKRFDRQTDIEWHVGQLNPEKNFALKREIWRKAYRVVGTYEGI